jgi:hypothetical protein
MRRFHVYFLRPVLFLLLVLAVSNAAVNPGSGPYLIANDDAPLPTNGVTFYTIGTGGTLTLQKHLMTGEPGIASGYFGSDRISVPSNADNGCIYMSEAFTGDVVGISASTETVGGKDSGSTNDTGQSNGVGLAANSQYVYASFSDSSNIGTFSVEANCAPEFVSDITASGLNGGMVNAMAVHGNILIVTYTDGSIESFNIASGVPVSNGDKQ